MAVLQPGASERLIEPHKASMDTVSQRGIVHKKQSPATLGMGAQSSSIPLEKLSSSASGGQWRHREGHLIPRVSKGWRKTLGMVALEGPLVNYILEREWLIPAVLKRAL